MSEILFNWNLLFYHDDTARNFVIAEFGQLDSALLLFHSAHVNIVCLRLERKHRLSKQYQTVSSLQQEYKNDSRTYSVPHPTPTPNHHTILTPPIASAASNSASIASTSASKSSSTVTSTALTACCVTICKYTPGSDSYVFIQNQQMEI